MDHEIELPWQGCMEVMADALGFRPVDHANRALQPSLSQHVDSFASSPKVKKETFRLELRENFFIAAGQWVAHGFRFRRSIPVGCRRHLATAGRKSDAKRFISIFLGYQLTNIDFATLPHFGCSRVAQM